MTDTNPLAPIEALADEFAEEERAYAASDSAYAEGARDAFDSAEADLRAALAEARQAVDALVAERGAVLAERSRFAELMTTLSRRLEKAEAERDHHRARADVMLAKLGGTVALRGRKPGDYWAEWHRDHCAAAQAAANAEAERDAAQAKVQEVARARNYAMRERDEERQAKEGNIAALNAVIAERDAAREALARVEALADEWSALHRRPVGGRYGRSVGANYAAYRLRAALDQPATDEEADQ